MGVRPTAPKAQARSGQRGAQHDLYTGPGNSGQKVEGISVEDVRAWPEDLAALRCPRGAPPSRWRRALTGRHLERGDVW